MEERVKVRVTVAQWPTHTPVFHKPDGQRFVQPNTLKVRANHKYLLETVITPARQLTSMRISGQTLLLRPVDDRRHRDLTRYSAIWCTTGYDVNKNKTRTFLPLMLEFQGENLVVTTVQCKVYPGEGEGGHYRWGQALHSIDLHCGLLTSEATFTTVITHSVVSKRLL
ncbi:CB1 cannabinoid receptor-interacting protein 1-like [Babylonia areolata]|uniref:CB1 cannabinoid receptor-interacting protein 1-like n=1 Tax=Babylonia areolata TaxID=304850 RepID=UPI003FCF1B5C